MSATNWASCPNCFKEAKEIKDKFITKYKDKLDNYVYDDILKEIDRKIKHLEYSETEFKVNKRIYEYILDNDIMVSGRLSDVEEIVGGEDTGCRVREDYEIWIKEDGLHMYYKGDCDMCSFHIEYKLKGVGLR